MQQRHLFILCFSKMKGIDKYKDKALETMATLALALIVLQFIYAEKLALSENIYDYFFLWIALTFLAIGLFSSAVAGLIFIVANIVFKEDLGNWYLAFGGLALLFSGFLPYKLSEVITYLWLKLGEGMGFVMSKVVLGSVFFVFVTPLSFFFRLFNKKHMQLNKGGDTYYITRDKTFEKKDLGNTW